MSVTHGDRVTAPIGRKEQPMAWDQTLPGGRSARPRAGPGRLRRMAATSSTRPQSALDPLNRWWPGCIHPQTSGQPQNNNMAVPSRPAGDSERRQGKRSRRWLQWACAAARLPGASGPDSAHLYNTTTRVTDTGVYLITPSGSRLVALTHTQVDAQYIKLSLAHIPTTTEHWQTLTVLLVRHE